MRTKWLALPATLLLLWACESAEEIAPMKPVERTAKTPSYTRPGMRGFEERTEGDSTGRARFCDEAEATAQVAELVNEPIIPDVSVGGVPLWTPGGDPIAVDDLLGAPEDGKLCDPSGLYSNAFVYGPLNEIIIFFNSETRLVEDIQVNTAYRGTLEGEVKRGDETLSVMIRTRDPIKLGDRELEEYASSAQQGQRTGSWLNHDNVTLIYGMIRQTFFEEPPLEPGYNCVAERRCDVIYTSSDEDAPQETTIVFQDSGITLAVSPEGQVLAVVGSPVRKATFELGGVVTLGEASEAPPAMPTQTPPAMPSEPPDMPSGEPPDMPSGEPPDMPSGEPPDMPSEPPPAMPAATPAAPSGTVAPVFQSALIEGCVIDLASDMTWADFRTRCVAAENMDRELARANYDVHGQRDAVSVNFDGITLDFLRKRAGAPVFGDGEPPSDEDILFSLTYTRSLPAPTLQFVAANLATDYAVRLKAHLIASLSPDAAEDHPFRTLDIPIPEVGVPGGLSTMPQRIGAIEVAGPTGAPESWVPSIIAAVQQFHSEGLTEEQRAQVDPDALKDHRLIDPFVGAVLSAFSFGRSDQPDAFTVYQTTDNERWSIGYSHFVQGRTPYRMIVQYSLYFGAVTAVTIERGTSEVDDVFDAVRKVSIENGVDPGNYYDLRLASPEFTFNPFRLGGDGIHVGDVDRKLGTVAVELAMPGASAPVALVVPGARIEDRAGYLRPLRGERVEFVPAHQVNLVGKETSQIFFVLEDGTIGRIQENEFKAGPPLCPGLQISFGQNVRRAIEDWHTQVGDSGYQNCELVFHYSPDGHLLEGVSSLANNVQYSTVAESATTVSVWR